MYMLLNCKNRSHLESTYVYVQAARVTLSIHEMAEALELDPYCSQCVCVLASIQKARLYKVVTRLFIMNKVITTL